MDRFLLSNEQRKYLGLTPIESHWERMDIKNVIVFFDGDIIRKKIEYSYSEFQDFTYAEFDVCVETAENRTIVLPKTAKGKPKKLNYTATTTFNPLGVYLRYREGYITIGNFTTQKTYFECRISEEKPFKEKFDTWLSKWIEESTEADIKDIEEFKNEKRKKQKYKEGDIFCFRHGRKTYGFGKIVIDVVDRRGNPEFRKNKNYGLDHLMGTALVVKVYHKTSDSPNIDIKELESCTAFPLTKMMDNRIYYNEYKIIGHSPVTNKDLDEAMISVSKSINHSDLDVAYLQYGLIYREIPLSEYKKHEKAHWKYYRNEDIGFSLFIDNFEESVRQQSNEPYFKEDKYDLRNPKNKEDKEYIFNLFGLDANLDYEGNLKLSELKE